MAKAKKTPMTPSDAPTKVKLLENVDIFDVYGCQELLTRTLVNDEDKEEIKARVYQIHEKYVNSSKARIKSEARYIIGADAEMTLASMLGMVRDMLAKEMEESAGPINLIQSLFKAHQAAGTDLEGINLQQFGIAEMKKEEKPKPKNEIDPEWFLASKNKDAGKMWNNPKWHAIAKAYIDLENATDAAQMCVMIDRLNQLQHNSFHILIDLQTGRMLENASEGSKYGCHDSARKTLQEILDIAKGKKDVFEYADMMSEGVRNLLRKYKDSPVNIATKSEAEKIKV